MKVPVISSLFLMLGIASPLSAIERPKALDDKVQEEAAVNRAVEVPGPEEELKEVAPGAWFGVFGQEADEALAAQLGIEGGVVLRFVAEGSPAADAGIKMHDVIFAVDGEAVRSQVDLRETVLKNDPGAEVKMDVVSGGVKKEVKVTLGARPVEVPNVPGGDPMEKFPELRRQMREFNPGGALEKQMEAQLKLMEEQLKMLELQPGFGGLEDLLDNLPKDGPMVDMKQTGSVKLMDDQGSVAMKMRDGGAEVEVHDKEGNLLYAGPWDTPQDKAAVEPELRERIESLNFNQKDGGMRLHFRHGFPPAQNDGAEPAEKEGAEVQ